MALRKPRSRSLSVVNAALRIGVKVMPWIPLWLKRLLAGGKKVTIDGNTLDSTVQLILAAQRITRTGGLSAADDPEVARTLMRNSHSVMGAHVAVPTADLTIPGPDSPPAGTALPADYCRRRPRYWCSSTEVVSSWATSNLMTGYAG